MPVGSDQAMSLKTYFLAVATTQCNEVDEVPTSEPGTTTKKKRQLIHSAQPSLKAGGVSAKA